MSQEFTAPVVALLFSVTASCAVQMFSGTKTASAIIFLFAAACPFRPILVCALPLMTYDALCEKRIWPLFPAALTLTRLSELTLSQLLVIAAGTVAAVIIYTRISALEDTVDRLAKMRNEIAESSKRIAKQNINIIKTQDDEIRLAAMKERSRLAREIHDNVGHLLTRSILQSGALIILNKDDSLREPLVSLKSTLDSAMTSMRRSVHDIHDDSIDLEKVINDCIGSVSDRFRVSFTYDAGADIPGRIKFGVAGIVKEGLSNAARHSLGDSIEIVFREHPGFYQLKIEDNGKCREISHEGIGLSNMEERADSIGGRISFTPSETGFRIFMSVPKGI